MPTLARLCVPARLNRPTIPGVMRCWSSSRCSGDKKHKHCGNRRSRTARKMTPRRRRTAPRAAPTPRSDLRKRALSTRKRRHRLATPRVEGYLTPAPENFFARTPPQKGYPLFWGRNRFWTGFWERGHEQFSESKSPPTGGRICRMHIQARLRYAEPCQSHPRCR